MAIAFLLVGLALAALIASLIAANSAGVVRVAAQTFAVVLASLTGALAGFLIPLTPLSGGLRGSALTAGILGTLGTIGGMSLGENLISRLESRR